MTRAYPRWATAVLTMAGLAGSALAADFVAGEILVKFRPNNALAEWAVPYALRARVTQKIGGIGVHRLRLRPGHAVYSAIRELRRNAAVEFVEPNFIVRAFEEPNDPRFPAQWGLAKIRCTPAWSLSSGSSDVVIAILDSGIDADHPDLASKLVPGYNFIGNNPNTNDDNGHGTHAAGIAAAATNNGIGISGVGFHTRLMPIKVLDSRGNGSTSDVAAGINFAVAHGAKVINMSFGGSSGSSAMQSAVNFAWNNDVLVVGAAGNNGTQQQSFPAAYSNVIAVAASDPEDQRAEFSTHGFWVDVAAPGAAIESTWNDGGYRLMNGTSMAAPHVSGLGALLWSHLGLSTEVEVIRSRIEENVLAVGSWVAHGRVDAERALFNTGPGEPIRQAVSPATLDIDSGIALSGDLSSVLQSDNQRMDLVGVSSSGGKRARVRFTGSPPWGAHRLALEISVEAHTIPAGLIHAWLWDWNLGGYVLIDSLAYGTSDRSRTFRTSNPGPYVGPNGEVRARIERFDSRNRPIRFRVDQIEIASVSLE